MSKRKTTNDSDHLVQFEIDGWTESDSDSDAETQADAAKGPLESADVQENALARKKRLKLSLNKRKKAAAGKENCPRFEFVNDAEAEALSKKFVPRNTATSTKWCVSTFESWRKERNARFQNEADGQVPMDLLKSSDAALIPKFLSLYVAEVRKKDGTQYPPKTVCTSNWSLAPHAVNQSRMFKLFGH